ncbi:MAG: aminodeoxychorismate/anthranilate synthase component II, partial [Bacteroidales bacterium]|nr:aminodeoxychorismate/anthranilate synthase component II [Bacteroidales bacterium]
ILHGQATPAKIIDEQEYLFESVPIVFEAGHYHSWVVDAENLPGELKITATDSEENVMAISHKTYDVKGLQFHPESIMTPYGRRILKNWLGKYS